MKFRTIAINLILKTWLPVCMKEEEAIAISHHKQEKCGHPLK